MKSKVASRSTCRARSERKIAAPLSTPTKITDCPEKSFVIWAPSSPTRRAMSCREISTLRSLMAFHIKLDGLISSTSQPEPPGGLRCDFGGQKYRLWHRKPGAIFPDEFEGHQTDMVRARDLSYRD